MTSTLLTNMTQNVRHIFASASQGRIQELGAGGGTGEGVAGGGAKLDAEPPRGGCGRGDPSRPARGSGGAL